MHELLTLQVGHSCTDLGTNTQQGLVVLDQSVLVLDEVLDQAAVLHELGHDEDWPLLDGHST